MAEREVLRYRRRSRVLHWLHALAFVVLFLTGLARFLHPDPSIVFYAVALAHRVAAAIFVGVPLIYCFIWPKQVTGFLKEVFHWNKTDIQWLKAAPPYYFGGPQNRMPAQGWIDPGQRAWEVAILASGLIFIFTGIPLWFFKYSIPLPVYQWALSVHAIAFIGISIFFLLHIYLGLFHPRFRESWRSMLDGRISAPYARMHYPKWFEKEKDSK